MEYPLISEYKEAILSAEDNFKELTDLRPVLDSHGDPVMSSGNFAVVFKMKNINDGKLYAVKCFLKEQEGRDESYRKIADELEVISSSYILPLRYLDGELFVDSSQCREDEFPVVVMEWVEGLTLDSFLSRNLDNRYELEMVSYRFNRMAAWLLAQPFAHGDLKPDNILVRNDGSLVLVDYDGMFVPSMKGEKARENGSPNYRHPLRSDADFNEHIDDFSIAVIALSLKAISLNPQLKSSASEVLLLADNDFRSPAESDSLNNIRALTADPELSLLFGIFYIALAKNSLESLSFRLFMTQKPKQPEKTRIEKIDTSCTEEDIANGIADEFGVIYSPDGTRLLKCNSFIKNYTIAKTCKVICDNAFNTVRTIFSCCKSLQSVTIPASVTSIGDSAFYGCESLQSVAIPSSVTSIGNGAFGQCKSLQSIIIPESVKTIGDRAFAYCKSLQSITIPDSVTSIGSRVFDFCESLQSVHIPETVASIGDRAFYVCTSLQHITLPASVTSIGDGAFYGCRSLQYITIPASVTSIGDGAFAYCYRLRITLSESSNFRLIGGLLINSVGRLIACITDSCNLTIPESVTSIGDNTFIGNVSLQSVTIPESVTSIGDRTFAVCKSLQSVIIPSSVMSIGSNAFFGCESLQSITIPDSVTSIGSWVFACCESLQSIHIPETVASIGDSAFSLCSSLQRVTIPASVTSIGNSAFEGCASLQSVTIPESVTSIGDRAFSWCKSLQSVTIPASVTSIGVDAFPRTCSIIRTK